jgi:hypothetical protein
MAAFISLERKPSSVAAGDQEEQIVFTDDETTVEGFDFDGFDLHIFGIEDYEEYFEYRNPAIELKCDSDRACARKRRRLFRTLFAVLLAIVAISFGALVPWLWKTEHLKTESHLKVENQSESTRSIACSNGHNLKIASWLGQNKSDSASICEPTVSHLQLFHQIGDSRKCRHTSSISVILTLSFPHSSILQSKQQI